jgi:hypothetical protein
MLRIFLTLMMTATCAAALIADDKYEREYKRIQGDRKETKKADRPKTGRLGELSREEEEKLDAVLDRFVRHEVCPRDPKGAEELKKLGPEAIPALIRGFNKAAGRSRECPVAEIAKRLKQLLKSSDDVKVLDFARDEIGAGVEVPTFRGIIDDLKLATIFRKRALHDKQTKSDERRTGNRE